MNHLDRFHSAQDSPDAGFDAALRELQAGRKRGHWIWYILPQLAGLGMSGMSQRYAIRDAQEAVAYLQDPVLRDRLLAIAHAIADGLARGVPLATLMGSGLDAQKTVSSLTLFGEVASRMARQGDASVAPAAEVAARILDAAERQGYPKCAFTLRRLGAQPSGGGETGTSSS